MCNCKKDIEARLVTRAKDLHPEATDHKVRLMGYSFMFGEKVTMPGVMPCEFTANFPLKKGGTKLKTEKLSITFNYCPFCGVKADKA